MHSSKISPNLHDKQIFIQLFQCQDEMPSSSPPSQQTPSGCHLMLLTGSRFEKRFINGQIQYNTLHGVCSPTAGNFIFPSRTLEAAGQSPLSPPDLLTDSACGILHPFCSIRTKSGLVDGEDTIHRGSPDRKSV